MRHDWFRALALPNILAAATQSIIKLIEDHAVKGTDQSVWMHRLLCSFDVCKPPKTGFLTRRLTS